jgi:hypothetical protein
MLTDLRLLQDCHKARLGITAAAFLFLALNAPLTAQAVDPVLTPGDILTATFGFRLWCKTLSDER